MWPSAWTSLTIALPKAANAMKSRDYEHKTFSFSLSSYRAGVADAHKKLNRHYNYGNDMLDRTRKVCSPMGWFEGWHYVVVGDVWCQARRALTAYWLPYWFRISGSKSNELFPFSVGNIGGKLISNCYQASRAAITNGVAEKRNSNVYIMTIAYLLLAAHLR